MWIVLLFAATIAWQLAVPRKLKAALNASRSAGTAFAAIAAAIGALILLRGNWAVALVCGVCALGALYSRPAAPAGPPGTTEHEAYAMLGLDSAATAADVHAAWRRLIAQVHPDHGGSNDLARRVTAARDLLLARLEPR